MKSTTNLQNYYLNLSINNLENEIFKPILGYEYIYEVSNLGRIISLERKVKHSNNNFKILKQKILKQSLCKGYLQVNLAKEGKVTKRTIHQLVAVAFLNHTPNGYKTVVDHKNNIKTDNRLDNLQLLPHNLTQLILLQCENQYTLSHLLLKFLETYPYWLQLKSHSLKSIAHF